MGKRGRPPKKKIPVLEDLPENMRKAMIKIMSDWQITDTKKAYEIAAKLIIKNGEQYFKDVNSEAERKYKSRHFKEQNKTVKTVTEKEYLKGFDEGWRVAEDVCTPKYPCSVCGETIKMEIGGSDTKAAIDYLVENRWAHGKCAKGK